MLNISADTLVCKHRLPGTKTPSKRSLEPRNQGGVPDDAAEEVHLLRAGRDAAGESGHERANVKRRLHDEILRRRVHLEGRRR